MKTYGDLNLKDLRDECGLDFAHFTYQRGMCSCCYNPKDLPARYWRGGIIPFNKISYFCDDFKKTTDDETKEGEYTYLLFKNADNGSGTVTKADTIEDYTCIEWGFPYSLLDKVVEMLAEQLDDDYVILKPVNHGTTIIIRTKEDYVKDKISDLRHSLENDSKNASVIMNDR